MLVLDEHEEEENEKEDEHETEDEDEEENENEDEEEKKDEKATDRSEKRSFALAHGAPALAAPQRKHAINGAPMASSR